MAHPICQYMGVTSFLIQPGNDVWKEFGKHLVVNRLNAAHSVFDIQFFSTDSLMVYSKTPI